MRNALRSGQLRSILLGVAVVLAAAAPAHATANGRAAGRGNRCAMRGDTLPATHKLGRSDTGNALSKRYYGSPGGALTILWSNGLKRWPPSKPIAASKRYRVGDTIAIPKPPKASINPPQRSGAGIEEGGHETVIRGSRKSTSGGLARRRSSGVGVMFVFALASVSARSAAVFSVPGAPGAEPGAL